MAPGLNRILYVGTEDGLYLAEEKGKEYHPHPLALQGKGALRSPVVIDRDDRRRIYAATARGGVQRSEDAGQTWREINNGILYKEAWCIVQHPKTGELVVGTGPSSVFKSADGGDSWVDCERLRDLPETIDWTFPRPPHVSHVKGLALRTDNPMFILGAVEEGWVIRSLDGGKSWQNIKDGVEFDAHSVAVMPDNPEVVIATSGQGVYKSSNGGDSFVNSSQGLDCHYMAQLVCHPARPKVLFTAAASVPPPFWRRPEGAASAFYRSENQGESWEKLSGGLPDHLKAAPRATAGDPEEPNGFFIGMNDGTIWCSTDGGESFHQIVGGLPSISSIRVAHA
jgi:photosystem II stability/assembly factor-like uncharacterized protein